MECANHLFGMTDKSHSIDIARKEEVSGYGLGRSRLTKDEATDLREEDLVHRLIGVNHQVKTKGSRSRRNVGCGRAEEFRGSPFFFGPHIDVVVRTYERGERSSGQWSVERSAHQVNSNRSRSTAQDIHDWRPVRFDLKSCMVWIWAWHQTDAMGRMDQRWIPVDLRQAPRRDEENRSLIKNRSTLCVIERVLRPTDAQHAKRGGQVAIRFLFRLQPIDQGGTFGADVSEGPEQLELPWKRSNGFSRVKGPEYERKVSDCHAVSSASQHDSPSCMQE
jgi:hypothetical protein